ncbi:molybdopterin converting factor subunit 1 [Lichenicoccus roseus]|uniref:Molybdopterin converting factor subunit 1 n=1 Tax=Lichenicoccus roseus TaxID=2683649 RepID=A0A5R9J8J6_9PROT|nr:molybdopterin converting factor subunit 1 [Lichenicoccus roseus]TLU73912.1 molybdopterin converting factor subunit 1 [Lichenicoccus roseus]
MPASATSLHILYFAWLKDRLGRGEDNLDLPAGVVDVAGLRAWLRASDPAFEGIFNAGGRVRAAVNQKFAGDGTPVRGGDEVAFFPPVTGG